MITKNHLEFTNELFYTDSSFGFSAVTFFGNLFSLPVIVVLQADFRNVRVYSSDVSAATLNPDSRMALTCGGNDAALIQWTVEEEYPNQNQYQYQ